MILGLKASCSPEYQSVSTVAIAPRLVEGVLLPGYAAPCRADLSDRSRLHRPVSPLSTKDEAANCLAEVLRVLKIERVPRVRHNKQAGSRNHSFEQQPGPEAVLVLVTANDQRRCRNRLQLVSNVV